MNACFKDFLGWLAEWNSHQRSLQRKVTAAILASVYSSLEDAGRHPRTEVILLVDSGLLSDQLAKLLHYAVRKLDKLEFEFEAREHRLPNAAELQFAAELAAEEELKREFSEWNLPF